MLKLLRSLRYDGASSLLTLSSRTRKWKIHGPKHSHNLKIEMWQDYEHWRLTEETYTTATHLVANLVPRVSHIIFLKQNSVTDVSVGFRPPRWSPSGWAHGVSRRIQLSINLGKTFLHTSCLRKIVVTWFLARGFAYLPSFFSQILVFIY